MALFKTGPSDLTAPSWGAGSVALLSGVTGVVALGTISLLMRRHKHGLRAEPKGQGPGPKHA